MTNSDSPSTDDSSNLDDSPPARKTPSDETARLDDAGATGDDGLEPSEESVEALAERVERLEYLVAWMARQQAAETGKSVCPECDTGGALTVSRTPTGKKQVECTNCGGTLN
ncbi:hypothetical protein [Halorussus salinisoli]|uniref:hypothetical protein n=1 Tax=Halorussus salinisoli TaxID=2558242 RepID=UPI0010C1669E|nr:hypothetical protein [Halorussus salinisoli]